MCDCASCEYTDKLSGWGEPESESYKRGGFANWPRGKPAGRSSDRDYAAHVRYSLQWGSGHGKPECRKVARAGGTRREDPHALYKWPQFGADECQTTAQYVRQFLKLNGLTKASPTEAEPARPDQPGKADPHLPELDRQREPAVIYAMPKSKTETKRPRGRPAMPGRKVLIKLADEQIKRAAKLGGGNVAAGIRKALSG